MKSDVLTISSLGNEMTAALKQVDKVSAYKGLSRKGTLHLQLLAEEMMGMMRSVTGETEGKFWIEDRDGVYELHLLSETRMTEEKRKQLLSASSSGRNESARTFTGWLRDLFEWGGQDSLLAGPVLLPSAFEQSSAPTLDWEWSMMAYERALSPYVEKQDSAALEAWDQLEKSVIARVADEVKVSIRGSRVEMTLYKKLD